MKNINYDEVNRILEYRPELGGSCLVWKVSPSIGVRAGQLAGGEDERGYWRIRVNGSKHRAHRLVWTLVHKTQPAGHIDHINGNTSDNRIENLRLAANGQADNSQNRKRRKDNQSGYTGVSKCGNKWVARIGKGRSVHTVGRFTTPTEAYAAYLMAKRKLHTFEPNAR